MAVPTGALVDRADLDAKFEAGDPEFFVTASEAEVRKHCGWHIAPSATVTDGRYPVGERGLIILPTLHLASVSKVVVDDRELDPSEYEVDVAGFITRKVPSWPHDPFATVSFTHGYTECPANVAAIVFELASKAIELPASPARDVTAGPFRLTLGSALGVSLSRDQERRLESYRLQGVR